METGSAMALTYDFLELSTKGCVRGAGRRVGAACLPNPAPMTPSSDNFAMPAENSYDEGGEVGEGGGGGDVEGSGEGKNGGGGAGDQGAAAKVQAVKTEGQVKVKRMSILCERRFSVN